METNTVYTANGWISQGCGIYSKDDKEPFYTRVARVSTEVPESEMIGVIELLRAAPETARKLAEAEARIAEMGKSIGAAIEIMRGTHTIQYDQIREALGADLSDAFTYAESV